MRESRVTVEEHYEKVAGVWPALMGRHFHVGYFTGALEDLDEATARLVVELARWGELPLDAKVIDVGCGTGETALLLRSRFGSEVLGIALTEGEVALARQALERRQCGDQVRFECRDIMRSELPANSFDVCWVMEASHLMRNKRLFFSEGARLLKREGLFLLCDFVLKREATVSDIFRHYSVFRNMEKVFGRLKSETLAYYVNHLGESGFADVRSRDVTPEVRPTFRLWIENAKQESHKRLSSESKEQLVCFERACETIVELMDEGLLGYGFIRAHKI